MEEPEIRDIERIAHAHQMSVSEWVRQTLRAARRSEPYGDPGKKLAVVRAAVRGSFPTGPIEQMLEEVEKGYIEGMP